MVDSRETRAHASETKFLIEPSSADAIRDWARRNLAADPHGTGPFGDEYQTASLYFDTPDLDVLGRQGSYGRAKYRIRRYAGSDVVFLERKLRTPRMVAKRRTCVRLDDLARLDPALRDTSWAGCWFLDRLVARRLRATCQISYHRTARGVLDDGGPARLTLDEAISAQPADAIRFADGAGAAIEERRLVLELKYRGPLPAVFRRLVAEFRLQPQAASKYRFGMAVIGHVVSEPAGQSGSAVGA